MPGKIEATPEQIALILQRRLDGATWRNIARELGVSHSWCQMQVRSPDWPGPSPQTDSEELSPEADHESFNRKSDPSMPAGHPVSWGAITDGTLLSGVTWQQARRVV